MFSCVVGFPDQEDYPLHLLVSTLLTEQDIYNHYIEWLDLSDQKSGQNY